MIASTVAVGDLGVETAYAWGDEGHEVIGLIALHELEPGAARRVAALLATDTTGLTPRDLPHEGTWADHYRDSDRDGSRVRYLGTRPWHFVDLELTGPDLIAACHGRPALASGQLASQGPAEDCVVDKIIEFQAELARPATPVDERRLALQYLLHLVGDLHQPLHASDDHDQGGNAKLVSGPGLPTVPLHHLWDVELVERLGSSPEDIASRLLARTTAAERTRWASGTPDQWAMETFAIGREQVYGKLPPADAPHHYTLSTADLDAASAVAAEQLRKAGVRLGWLLNGALH